MEGVTVESLAKKFARWEIIFLFLTLHRTADCIASYHFNVITFYLWDSVTILNNIKRTR